MLAFIAVHHPYALVLPVNVSDEKLRRHAYSPVLPCLGLFAATVQSNYNREKKFTKPSRQGFNRPLFLLFFFFSSSFDYYESLKYFVQERQIPRRVCAWIFY